MLDAKADLVARNRDSGYIYLYPGTGYDGVGLHTLGARTQIGTGGWTTFQAIA